MLKIIGTTVAAVLLIGASIAYYRYSIGVIEPQEIRPEALGWSLEKIYAELGRPRRVDHVTDRIKWAFWQGRSPYSWKYSIWFIDQAAVQIEMPNDLIGLEIGDLRQRLDSSADWKISDFKGPDDLLFPAWTNEDQSIIVYDSGVSFIVANDRSILWSKH